MNVLDMPQPIIAKAEPLAAKRGAHSAAPVMPAHDDVPDFQNIDGELHHRQTIQVRVHDQVRDVAMNEQFARRQAHDLVRRHPAIRATDPEIFRRLLPGQLQEKFRLHLPDPLGPGAVVLEEMIQRFHFLAKGDAT